MDSVRRYRDLRGARSPLGAPYGRWGEPTLPRRECVREEDAVADHELADAPARHRVPVPDRVAVPRHVHHPDSTIAPDERPGHLPHAARRQRADPLVRAGIAGARRAAAAAGRDGGRAHRDPARDRRRARRDGHDVRGRDAARPRPCARRRREGRRVARRARDRRGPRGARGLGGDAVARARRRLPARRRAALGPVALDAQRGDDAEPVEDRAPGRDRRRVRDDRLPPLQRGVPRPDLRGAADLVAGRLEPARVPAARGVRLRDQPVQLHGDRREPDDVAGADGQHRRLEARVDRRRSRPGTRCGCSRRRASRRA